MAQNQSFLALAHVFLWACYRQSQQCRPISDIVYLLNSCCESHLSSARLVLSRLTFPMEASGCKRVPPCPCTVLVARRRCMPSTAALTPRFLGALRCVLVERFLLPAGKLGSLGIKGWPPALAPGRPLPDPDPNIYNNNSD